MRRASAIPQAFAAVTFAAAISAPVACVPARSAGSIVEGLQEPAPSGAAPALADSMAGRSLEASVAEVSTEAEAGDRKGEVIQP